MKNTFTIFCTVCTVASIFFLSPSSALNAQTKKAVKKPVAKKTVKKKAKAKPKLTAAEKEELKKAKVLLKQLNTYKKGQFTRLLNSGKKTKLMALPKVGEATADRIIAARPLESSAHLVLIKGIGLKTFSEMIDARK